MRAKTESHPANVLQKYYSVLFEVLGPQGWWPGKTPFEVCVGAILTQNTAWVNVERAIENLRREELLTPGALEKVSSVKLAQLIRSSGYFRQKARKLKAFMRFLRKEYGGSLPKMFRTPTAELRKKLLGVPGIGPETADCILLYAGGHPVFVVDAYTRRIFERHGLADSRQRYDDLRTFFESKLRREASLFNEYHALLVRVGKNWCRAKNPRCEECPLGPYLPPIVKNKLVDGARTLSPQTGGSAR